MSEFTVHDLLKDVIMSSVTDEGMPVFLIYEEVACSVNDLAFSYDQFMDSVGCLVENKYLNANEVDGVTELSLSKENTTPRLDVN